MRVRVARGSMLYSLEIQPLPELRMNCGTVSSIEAVQMTRVLPTSIRTEPSAVEMKSGVGRRGGVGRERDCRSDRTLCGIVNDRKADLGPRTLDRGSLSLSPGEGCTKIGPEFSSAHRVFKGVGGPMSEKRIRSREPDAGKPKPKAGSPTSEV